MEHTHLMKTGNFDEFCFKKRWHLNIQWEWPRCPSPWHSRHLSCWVFNVWSRQVWDNQCLTAVLSGIPCVFHFQSQETCLQPKKITTFFRWQWKYLTALLSKFVPYGDHNFKDKWDKCGIKLKKNIKKTNPVNTLRPRDSFCFLLVSSHFFYPKFKRPIPSQKWILKQQVRTQHPKAQQKITCPCTNPFRHLASATPKTTHWYSLLCPQIISCFRWLIVLSLPCWVSRAALRVSGCKKETLPKRPFQGHGRRCWPRPPWPLQRSAARPRRNGLSEPHIAAPSGLGAEDARRTAGQLQLPSRNKAYSHGMFLQAVGQNSEYRSQISDPPSILFVCFSVRHGENKSSNHRNICSCSIVLFKPYQQLHLAYFRSIMRRVSRNYFMKNVGLSKCG